METSNIENSQKLASKSFAKKVENIPNNTVVIPKGHVYLKLFFHSILMFSVPFVLYFSVKAFVEKNYNLTSPQSYICGVIAAVVSVQFIIASYVYQAFREEEKAKASAKKTT